jgi:hypothetical protein
MTMVSLFFYNQLMNLERKRRDPSPDTDDVFFLAENEPKDREHYEEDGEWPDEDEYRE